MHIFSYHLKSFIAEPQDYIEEKKEAIPKVFSLNFAEEEEIELSIIFFNGKYQD